MKPNHHWAVHTADQIRDFGPMHDFWTFLTERLNKILKNVNNNNWGGGRLEISMMRAFGRDSQFETMVRRDVSFSPVRSFVAELFRQRRFNLRPTTQVLLQLLTAC
jgi:hypothetical protein